MAPRNARINSTFLKKYCVSAGSEAQECPAHSKAAKTRCKGHIRQKGGRWDLEQVEHPIKKRRQAARWKTRYFSLKSSDRIDENTKDHLKKNMDG